MALKAVLIAPDGETVATEDGEIVPGVTATMRPDVFKIEIKEGKDDGRI